MDAEIQSFLAKKLNFCAMRNKQNAYVGVDFVIIATLTDYDPQTQYFNSNQSVELVTCEVMTISDGDQVLGAFGLYQASKGATG